MNKYLTGYICNDISEEILKGKNFTIKFNTSLSSTNLNGKEVIIFANNRQIAEKVTRLISAALSLIDAHVSIYNNEPPNLIIEGERNQQNGILFSLHIFSACKIACKVSYKRKYYYALFKYQLACNLHSNFFVDLDPAFSSYESISPYPDDHIRLAYAIVIFYSVIELGAEIRASHKNPSMLKDGTWNPKVKEDLENRLKEQGININEFISWDLRSTPSIIEKRKKPQVIEKVKWAYGNVRDSYISIIDAISIVSFVRSRIASHKVKDAISSISIYDVSNANHLARRILLEAIGFWKNDR